MRFLFIIKSFAQVAGVERVMSDKMNYLEQQGHQILLLTYEQGHHPLIFHLNHNIKHVDIDCCFFRLHGISILKRIYKSIKLKQTFKERIKKVIADFKPDAVISPTYPPDVIGELVCTKGKAKLILESHMAYIQLMKSLCKKRSFVNNIAAKIYDWKTLYLLKQCDCMVVLTRGDYLFWSKHLDNVRILPNPLTFYPSNTDDVEKEQNRIISIGRLTAIKRFDRLIDAFAIASKKNPNWHLDIFGDGSDKDILNAQITTLGLENRIFIHPATNDIYTEIKRSQFLAMTSESEGFTLVLIEAMSCGVPCLSFDCPYGPGEIIEDKKNGILVSNGNTLEFANKMEYLMNHPDIVKGMGDYARKTAEQYKKEVVIKKWEQLYLEESNSTLKQ